MSWYKLTDKEYVFLSGGKAPGSYRPHELEDSVDEKASRVPARVQSLCAEVDMLERRGYLEDTKLGLGGVLWGTGDHTRPDDIANVFERPQFRHKEEDGSSFWGSANEGFNDHVLPAELGLNIGRLVRQITEDTGEMEQEDEIELLSELVYGYIEGLCYHHKVLHEDEDEIDMEHRDKMAEAIAEKLLSVEQSFHANRHEEFKEYRKRRREAKDRVCNILEDRKHPDWWAKRIIKHLGWGQTPVGQSSQGVQPEEIDEEVVDEVIRKNSLREDYEEEIRIEEDADRIEGLSYRGVDFVEVLESLNKDSPQSSEEIGDIIDEYQAGVTVVAGCLAGDNEGIHGMKDRHVWSKKPLVEGDRDRWGLTEYGKKLVKRV